MATATAPDVPRGSRGSLGPNQGQSLALASLHGNPTDRQPSVLRNLEPNLPGSLIVLNLATEDRGPMSLMSILENRMNTTNIEKEIVTSIRD
jgi:hypothetical protein